MLNEGPTISSFSSRQGTGRFWTLTNLKGQWNKWPSKTIYDKAQPPQVLVMVRGSAHSPTVGLPNVSDLPAPQPAVHGVSPGLGQALLTPSPEGAAGGFKRSRHIFDIGLCQRWGFAPLPSSVGWTQELASHEQNCWTAVCDSRVEVTQSIVAFPWSLALGEVSCHVVRMGAIPEAPPPTPVEPPVMPPR
ncbi:hypothetical protein mRhiFer1_008878 [Rhinolophus ferrumequinum]|uniref:Uncharacterized protein n=1 Tax=Rhinolophus ferrumequinum TaxID=59479 RepID=A0A7J8AF43_RHIFE|nr:hypothetical protein mRhiFer1_008878 [Rhinolophus ferrumequinum]